MKRTGKDLSSRHRHSRVPVVVRRDEALLLVDLGGRVLHEPAVREILFEGYSPVDDCEVLFVCFDSQGVHCLCGPCRELRVFPDEDDARGFAVKPADEVYSAEVSFLLQPCPQRMVEEAPRGVARQVSGLCDEDVVVRLLQDAEQ